MDQSVRRGGSYFIAEVPAAEVFTPEDFSQAHEMIGKTTERFIRNEVAPHIEEIEHKDFDSIRRLMREAGALGLLGADIEEEYGGSDMGITASQLIVERSAWGASFGVTLNVHTGIGSMPLVFFGTRAQKEKHLAALARGEKIGCYALTEPGSGTDALSIQTTATLSPDGTFYRLDGAKQFITNAGFADIIFTYAKVDGDKFTAFLVERGFEGVSTGPEERKMGIRGTSTCSVYLDGARVPVENVLFQVGRGHIVAFNILNLGRFKVAAGCVGMAKQAIESAVGYSRERHQFGRPVCQFGLMKHKIAEIVARTYAAESMVYRTCGLIETAIAGVDRAAEDVGAQSAGSLAEYAIECSINKVYCSEMLALVADEAVQMYGGYGYTEEYPVERIYRDSKIFRIYEGTNEINRVIIASWLTRKALKNELPLSAAADRARGELPSVQPLAPSADDGPLGYQRRLLDRAKTALVLLCDDAVRKYGKSIEDEQEILGPLSNIAIEVYAMDCGLTRALKAVESTGEEKARTKVNIARLYVNDAMDRVAGSVRQVLPAMESGEALDERLAVFRKLLQFTPIHSARVRNEIADEAIEVGRYTC